MKMTSVDDQEMYPVCTVRVYSIHKCVQYVRTVYIRVYNMYSMYKCVQYVQVCTVCTVCISVYNMYSMCKCVQYV